MLSEELKKERSEREAERKEQLKEKEETRVIFESMKQFQELLLNINDEDTDEEVGSQVKLLARKIKKGVNKKKSNNTKEQVNHQNEIEQELNLLQKTGLQSLPNNAKSDSSSKFIVHSVKTERI